MCQRRPACGRCRFGNVQIGRHGKPGAAIENHVLDAIRVALDGPRHTRIEGRPLRLGPECQPNAISGRAGRSSRHPLSSSADSTPDGDEQRMHAPAGRRTRAPSAGNGSAAPAPVPGPRPVGRGSRKLAPMRRGRRSCAAGVVVKRREDVLAVRRGELSSGDLPFTWAKSLSQNHRGLAQFFGVGGAYRACLPLWGGLGIRTKADSRRTPMIHRLSRIRETAKEMNRGSFSRSARMTTPIRRSSTSGTRNMSTRCSCAFW